jgi:cobalt-zinc-cadmium efflux system outer membrane protein
MTLVLALVALFCAPVGAAHAQPAEQAAQEKTVDLTLEEALARAEEYAPQVRQAAQEVEVARAEVTSASVLTPYNPTLSAGAGPRVDDEVTLNLNVALGQRLELGGKRGARIKIAQAGVDRESRRKEDIARQQQVAAARAYLEALHAQEQVEVAEAIAELSAEFVDAATRREQAGDVGQMEVNLARLTLERSKSTVLAWKARLSAKRGTLVATLGLEPAVELRLTSDLEREDMLALSALEETLEERPDLAALRAQAEMAQARGTLAEAQSWPDVGVEARYGREEGANIFMGGLSVTLPVFAHGQGLAHAATATERLANQRLTDEARAAKTRLASAFKRYETLLEARAHYQEDVLPLVNNNEEMTRQAYQAGALGLAEVLAVRRELIEAREAYVDLALECALARVEAQFIAGVL